MDENRWIQLVALGDFEAAWNLAKLALRRNDLELFVEAMPLLPASPTVWDMFVTLLNPKDADHVAPRLGHWGPSTRVAPVSWRKANDPRLLLCGSLDGAYATNYGGVIRFYPDGIMLLQNFAVNDRRFQRILHDLGEYLYHDEDGTEGDIFDYTLDGTTLHAQGRRFGRIRMTFDDQGHLIARNLQRDGTVDPLVNPRSYRFQATHEALEEGERDIDINTASASLLLTLPGLGPQRVAAILSRRDELQGISTFDQLSDILPKTVLADLRTLTVIYEEE